MTRSEIRQQYEEEKARRLADKYEGLERGRLADELCRLMTSQELAALLAEKQAAVSA
jgi:hypothetical protein